MEEATRAELERLELLLMDPAVRRDRERVAGLLADDFMEFGSSGRMWTREATLELLATETYTPPTVETFACRMLDGNVALVTYHALRIDAATGEPDGYAAEFNLDEGKSEIGKCDSTKGRAQTNGSAPELQRYISWRLKIVILFALGQFVHSRQQTRSTATPKVTRMANTLAYEAIQCNKLCISHGGLRSHPTPPLGKNTSSGKRLGGYGPSGTASLPPIYIKSPHESGLAVRRIKDENWIAMNAGDLNPEDGCRPEELARGNGSLVGPGCASE